MVDRQRTGEAIILATLTAAAAALSGVLLHRGLTTWLEAASFVTGAVCVWLTVRESVWNFPVGMANVVAFLFVFGRAQLYADAGLQVVYFVLGAIGWYLWLFGGAGRTPLRVTVTPAGRAGGVTAAGVAMAGGLFLLNRRLHDASPLLDAVTTSLSLCAQWLLDRKHVENWLVWIAADLIYVPLYASRGLYLTGVLYAVFLVMCVIGLRQWRRPMRASPPARGFEVALPG